MEHQIGGGLEGQAGDALRQEDIATDPRFGTSTGTTTTKEKGASCLPSSFGWRWTWH